MITKFENANVYLNGQTMVGKTDEVNLPTIKQKMETIHPLGMSSEVDIPSGGIEKMEATIKFYEKFPQFAQLVNWQNVNVFTVRGVIANWSSLGKAGTGSSIITMTGIVHTIPLGSFKKGNTNTTDVSMSVWGISWVLDGNPVVTIDIMTNTYIVGDVDLLLKLKQLF